jgi:hypothetical protein
MSYRNVRLEFKFSERVFEKVTLLAGGDNAYRCPISISQPANDGCKLDNFGTGANDESKCSDWSCALKMISARTMHTTPLFRPYCSLPKLFGATAR